MSARKKTSIIWILATLSASSALFATNSPPPANQESVAKQLGWVDSSDNHCGGYYLEEPFTVITDKEKEGEIQISGNFGVYALQGTSTLEGAVITRSGQQIKANTAYLYRDPTSHKRVEVEMVGDVHLREPNTLIIAKRARYNFVTNHKTLYDILYRTTLIGATHQIAGAKQISSEQMSKARRITGITGWGHAHDISQEEPRIYEMAQASYTTCPPNNPAWQIKGSRIVLNKNTGRGYASHLRGYIKDIPVFYFPYINFSIDNQRKTGFLWPTLVFSSSQWGPSIFAPFYLNMAPNYDMFITPGILSKRGMQLSDRFRYLTHTSSGSIYLSLLPSDRAFSQLQKEYRHDFSSSNDPTIEAELNRLLNSSTTRRSFYWHDETRYNQHWTSNIDFNYAGDDYYLQDFGNNLTEITQNQILQLAEVNYKDQHWNFLGRLQGYQTLHPIIYTIENGALTSEPPTQNQYRRYPQLILNGDYPNQPLGLDFFISNELTHFDIRNTPGTSTNLPKGNRMHMQPGVSLPLYWPYFFVNPRAQLALSDYQLYQNNPTGTPGSIRRAIPIFDIASGLAFSGDNKLFNYAFEQTLEPQVYYTYIPYHDQSSIPIFDTTVNTLTYDQIFNYNRFTGLDRIGDANQVGVGVTSRLIDSETGLEKARIGIGEIAYFANRKVTFCNNPEECTDNPDNPNLKRSLSPLSGLLSYSVNEKWALNATSIWNPITKQLDNATIGLNFKFDEERLMSFGYNYARGGDILSGIQTTDSEDNLKVTEFYVAWPALQDVSMVGKWSQNWNRRHLQNLLYGLQYDSCCWAIRLVGGRAFYQYQNNTPQYNTEYYVQFALKGLGDIGTGNASNLLSSFNGYNSQFG